MTDMETFCGDEIKATIFRAIELAKQTGDHVGFDFNGVKIVAAKDSSAELLYRDWNRGLCGYLGSNVLVGPYPKEVLSAEDLASDAKIEEAKEIGRRERERIAALDMQAQQRELSRALLNAPALDLIDSDGWEKFRAANTTGYGARVVRYAEEWARLMQAKVAEGRTIADCADELSHLADDDGITGAMFGFARGVLVRCWRHGHELEAWWDNRNR